MGKRKSWDMMCMLRQHLSMESQQDPGTSV